MCQVVINVGNPTNKSVCELCGVKTEAWAKQWLSRCPKCWQLLTTK